MKKEVCKDTDAKTGAEQAMPKQDSQAQDTAKKGYTSRDSTGGQEHAYPGQEKDKEGAEKEAAGSVSINVDGKTIEIKDQIHMYTTNRLLSHPLVSPALQPSLGGLPPLLVLTGGGEMLRDEQIYLAHKAAHPTAYPPGDVYLDEYDPNGETLSKYPPTFVQLQVWDNLCHVAPTLSFSRPAKYMFRSISQFGAWAFAHAQNTEIDILVDNDPAISSPDDHSSSSSSSTSSVSGDTDKNPPRHAVGSIGKAGDPLPDFENHMIRQRVDKRGHVYPLDPTSSFEALQMPASEVGAFNPVLVKRWLAAKQEWDEKFAKEKLRVQKQRMTELYHQFQNFKDETPPPSSLAARREAPGVLPPRRERKSYLMMMWSSWASKHDKRLVGKAGKEGGGDTKSVVDTGQIRASRASSSSDEGAKPVPPEKSAAVGSGQSGPQSGPKGITIDADTANKALAEQRKRPTNEFNRGDSASNQPGSPMTYKSSLDRPLGSPLLVLPDYDKKNVPIEENASTRALFHAPGTLPASASDTSLSRITKSHRPTSSYTTSIAPTEDANSTIADEKSLAVTNTTGGGAAFDNASTRALLNSTGVVGAIPLASGTSSARQSIDARRSIDALSRTASDIDAVSFVGGADEAANGRPKMPERDIFRTADEF